jgi:AcrR family transcriptional regulator
MVSPPTRASCRKRGHSSSPRIHNRQPDLLAAAARVFREKGYAQATMRDIAAASGMIAGSIYYHYAAKSDLMLAVYTEGVRRMNEAVDRAASAPGDAWSRFERAVRAHLEAMLGNPDEFGPYASVFVHVQPQDFPPDCRDRMIALRNDYEARFKHLITELPLRRGTDRSLLRLFLVGALNHVPIWYRPDGAKSLAAIARAISRQLRQSLDRDFVKESA